MIKAIDSVVKEGRKLHISTACVAKSCQTVLIF